MDDPSEVSVGREARQGFVRGRPKPMAMEFWDWFPTGYPFIQWLQRFHHPVLDVLFINITRLGNEEFYWLFLPGLYWLGDRRLGARIILLFLVSVWINDLLKNAFALPRPSPEVVRVLYPESGMSYGFPSGHAQFGTALWGGLALELRRRWVTWAAAVLIALLSLSRLYLGLHFPLDVWGGLGIGLATLAVYARLIPGRAAQPSGGRAIPLPTLLLALLALLSSGLLLDRREPNLLAKPLGLLLGAGIGWWLTARGGCRHSPVPWPVQLAKLLIGYAAMFGVILGLAPQFPEHFAGRLARYALIGFVTAGGVPWLFARLRLEPRPAAPGGD